MKYFNIYYVLGHSVFTFGIIIVLFFIFPRYYQKRRNSFMLMTTIGLLGFIIYPLMPPRLLTTCDNHYGACDKNFTFVDSLEIYGGPLNWKSKRMADSSNYYAAMPSLHFGWSLWCFYSLYPLCPNIFFIFIISLHPIYTLFVIIVTANHYILDAMMGCVTFLIGEYLLKKTKHYIQFGRGSYGTEYKTKKIVVVVIALVIIENFYCLIK